MDERWFPDPPGAETRLLLFCFPYAGGGAATFRPWRPLLPADVAVCGVQLPGRETRRLEPPVADIADLVTDLLPSLTARLDRPYALFGHSLGALVAYEIVRRLRADGGPLPEHFFASASRAPHTPVTSRPLHVLSDDELLDELRRLGGTPRRVLDDVDIMRVFLPMLRADLSMSETYRCTDEAPLDLPISIFGGTDDADVKRWKLDAWEEQTTRPCRTRMLPGDHFFIQTARDALLDAIGTVLGEPRPKPRP